MCISSMWNDSLWMVVRGMRIINLIENTEGSMGCAYAHGLSFYVETKKHKGSSQRWYFHNIKVDKYLKYDRFNFGSNGVSS